MPLSRTRLVFAGKGGCYPIYIPRGRGFAPNTGDLFFCSARFHWSSVSCDRHLSSISGRPFSDRKVFLEKLWHEFFSDPSQWWDHRSGKANSRYPDFKNKKTQQSLWLLDDSNPPWVGAKLDAMAPGILQSSIFSWNLKLRRCAKAGDYTKTMDVFKQMQREGMVPDTFTFVPVLNACSALLALAEGRHIHSQIIKSGFECDLYVGSSLVDMYAKCGSIEDARRLFDKMPKRDVVVWNTMILGYVKCGQAHEALALSRQMRREGVDLRPITFIGMLNACVIIESLEDGRHTHQQIIERRYESDVYVASSLVNMYAKCGSIDDAWIVFNKMPTRDVVAWSAMILGCVKCKRGQEALELFRQMQREGVDLDSITFVAVLNACAEIESIEEGRRVHSQIIARGYDSDVFVASSLVDMYAKCGSIEDARRVFDKMPTRDVVVWSSMIMRYLEWGQGQEALELFRQMQRDGVDLNAITLVGVLNACASTGSLEEGRLAHQQVIDRGYESDLYIINSLVDMYAKCGSMEDARRVFDNIQTRDVVSWNSLILGYVRSGEGQEALDLSRQMQREGVDFDRVTLVGVLSACASIASLAEGRRAHEHINDRGYEYDPYVASSLIDMYAKCGSIEDARRLFNKMPTKDVVSWNTMLAGYGLHGCAKEALEGFEQMCRHGVEVNEVTFVSILSASRHGGFVEEGIEYLGSMSTLFDIYPTVEHYACIIDLLGRAGRLHEAKDLIRRMPCEPDATVWTSLLGASTAHGNVEMAECGAERLLEFDTENAASYVLLSNIYAATNKPDDNASSPS